MKIEITSSTTKTTKYKTRRLKVDKFKVIELYVNDVLTEQSWAVYNKARGFKTTHPDAYEAHQMRFAYYEDISFLDSETCCNYQEFYDEIPKPKLITDWDKFKGFDYILCNWLGMEGCIYRINNPKSIPIWRHRDYIGGFGNDEYDLDKVKQFLEKKTWTRNVLIIEIPHYNAYDGRTHAVEFDYKLSNGKELKNKLSSNKLFKDKYFSECG